LARATCGNIRSSKPEESIPPIYIVSEKDTEGQQPLQYQEAEENIKEEGEQGQEERSRNSVSGRDGNK
jgi:hypothetical protein